ncbi:MAG: type I glyceraldehyde-3-phosphate dehydrogenase [Bacteroidota bacterium]
MKKIRLGLMGFGEINRHLYRLCLEDERIEVVAISDIGRPEILVYLLEAESKRAKGKIDAKLEGNYLVSKNGKARFVKGKAPTDVPWDAFNVDVVVDGTGKYRSREEMEGHLKSGAKHVILASLPSNHIDRIVVNGVNDHTIKKADKLISASSSTTTATAIMLKILDEAFGVEYAMLTTVHSYTADQPLRDTAGHDFRRSRSAAENIIPNETPTPRWIQEIMPEFKGRIEGTALNVPIPAGSLLDFTLVLKDEKATIEQINMAIEKAAKKIPGILQVIEDPIVSVDVVGNSHSVIYDKQATMRSKGRMVKVLTWYHNTLAMAARIKDIMLAYQKIYEEGGAK